MKALLLLCHPSKKSFNKSIAEHITGILENNGHSVFPHNLYTESFDPVLTEAELRRGYSLEEDIQKYTEELEEADLLVIIHPDWWNQPPALLKGWLDRVLRPGIAYDFEGEEHMKKHAAPLLTGKRALIICTTDDQYTEDHPLRGLWAGVLGYCGIKDIRINIFSDTHESTYERRLDFLEKIETQLLSMSGK